MDNITHSLIGAIVGLRALPQKSSRRAAQAIVGASIVANNFPDADLLYSAHVSAPLGYLLHHRGHTHTILGALGCALVAWWAVELLFRALGTRLTGDERSRLLLVTIGGGLLHISLDWLNTYGVHPFWPVSNAWVYGDTLFIIEPLIWITLALAILHTTASALAKILPFIIILGGTALIVLSGFVPDVVAIYFFLFFVVSEIISRYQRRVRRSTVWIFAASLVLFHFVMFGGMVRRSPEYLHTQGLELISFLSPSPANPFCWTKLSATRVGSTLVYQRTTIAPLDRWLPIDCPAHAMNAGDGTGDSPLVIPVSLVKSVASDCSWQAFLRFSRLPVIVACDGSKTCFDDYRFMNRGRRAFSRFELSQTNCPTLLPPWEPPAASIAALSD